MGYRPDKPYNGSDRLRRLLPERRCWVSGYPGCRNSPDSPDAARRDEGSGCLVGS